MNILDPDLKRGPWTEEEDALLLELVARHGEKWTLIAAECEGRTDNMVSLYCFDTFRLHLTFYLSAEDGGYDLEC